MKKKILSLFIIICIITVVSVLILGLTFSIYISANMEKEIDETLFEFLDGSSSSKIYYYDTEESRITDQATELSGQELYGGYRNKAVKYEDIPKNLIYAFVSICEQAHQPVQPHRQKVKYEVQHRHGKEVAGDKGHRRSGSEIEQALTDDRQNGHKNAHRLKAAEAGQNDDRQSAGDDIRNEHHGHTGEEIGEEQALPADGQSVHHAGAAGLEQIAPYRNGHQNGIAQRNDGHAVGHDGVIDLRGGQGVHLAVIVAQQLRQHGHRKQRSDKGGCGPQRPEPGQVLAKQRFIKERSL